MSDQRLWYNENRLPCGRLCSAMRLRGQMRALTSRTRRSMALRAVPQAREYRAHRCAVAS